MRTTHLLEDPLAGAQLRTLRDSTTRLEDFRAAAHRLGLLLTAAALGDAPSRKATVTTPLGEAPSRGLANPVVAVPVLRAGLAFLPAVLAAVPDAGVGFVGLQRDEETARASEYYRKFPAVEDAHVLVLEPMLATGGSASRAISAIGSAQRISLLSAVATTDAIHRLAKEHPDVGVYVAGVDPELNDQAFIVPGLGDFGDRYCGTD